jgi:DNA modification methylase
MNSNKIYHGDALDILPTITAGTVDLVIGDPPYWKVVGESWDYQWRTEEDYVNWSLIWLEQVTKIMRLGGTLYLFGYFRTLALLTPHFKKLGLELRQQVIIDKGIQAVSGRATKGYKQFPNVTESVLMIIKDSKPFIRNFLKEQQKRVGLSAKEINDRLGVKSNGGGMWSIYTGKNICEQVPTRELWERMQVVLDFRYPYEKLAQTFNAEMGLTDVWTDINFYGEKRVHKTQKPQKLIQRLIRASSNAGDLILDPFAGSGSTDMAAKILKRSCISIEANSEYINEINARANLLENSHIENNNTSNEQFSIF